MDIDLQELDRLWSGTAERGDAPSANLAYEAARACESAGNAERDAAEAMCQSLQMGEVPLRRTRPAVIIAPWAAQSQVLRSINQQIMTLDYAGEVWDRASDWLRYALANGSEWLKPAAMPIAPKCQQCLDTVVRLLKGGQQVLFVASASLPSLMLALQLKGVPLSALENQCFIVPPSLSYARPVLEVWFRTGCPSLPAGASLPATLRHGQLAWAVATYEGIFRILLSARQARDGAQLSVGCSRAILQLLVWLREGEETALRMLGTDRGAARDAGVVRCTPKKGMLLLGVNWKVVGLEELRREDDLDWLSFLYSRDPEAEAQMAAAGWNGGSDDAGNMARHETLGRAFHSDLTLVTRSILRLGAGGEWVMGSEFYRARDDIYRRGTKTSLNDVAVSSGALDRALEALAARLAFRFGKMVHGGPAGSRRRFELKLQRAVGVADIPTPTAVVSAPSGVDFSEPQWRGIPLSFRWAMPMDRRRRDVSSAIDVLSSAMLLGEPGAIPAMLGAAALDGLISLDAQSLFFGPRGESLGAYLWTNFPHLFQPEYIGWVRRSLHEPASGDLIPALAGVISDLAAVLK